MTDSNLTIFKRYAAHTFLQWFTQSLLVSFGALFIYAKTGSIGLALVAELANIVGDLIIRSPLINWLWNSVFRRRQILAMTVGIIITVLASLGIFFADVSKTYAGALLILLSGLNSMGTSIYWIPSNAIFFRVVGNSNTPGKYTSLISVLHIFSAALAAGVALFLNVQNNFLLLLPFLAVMALISLIPLIRMRLPLEEHVSWLQGIRKMSISSFFANLGGDNRLKYTGLPLILVLLYGSVSESVSIGALTLLVAAALGYFAGKLKDANRASLFIIAIVGLIFVWIAYAVVKVPAAFVILGALEYVFSTVLSIGRDARLGRTAANDGHFVESTIAIEFARAVGSLSGMLILILAYWATSTLPQFILVAGILFVIPRGLYAVGALEQLRVSEE